MSDICIFRPFRIPALKTFYYLKLPQTTVLFFFWNLWTPPKSIYVPRLQILHIFLTRKRKGQQTLNLCVCCASFNGGILSKRRPREVFCLEQVGFADKSLRIRKRFSCSERMTLEWI
ncbi:hypothetical protein L596_028078 [Steinernema carpocapsae]|uniref:Uncharacterized protein n=1 Tax=Steinernema carpocapsae TaxID=34508 RepID=A0A4U5LXD8_STECR|nr:hypothetical protein L596_028078 [Steinernema carpocapsae]